MQTAQRMADAVPGPAGRFRSPGGVGLGGVPAAARGAGTGWKTVRLRASRRGSGGNGNGDRRGPGSGATGPGAGVVVGAEARSVTVRVVPMDVNPWLPLGGRGPDLSFFSPCVTVS